MQIRVLGGGLDKVHLKQKQNYNKEKKLTYPDTALPLGTGTGSFSI